MKNPFGIVKDSSIWFNPTDFSATKHRDMALRLGIVKKATNDEKTNELRYLVEVQNHNDKIELNCRVLRRFGGVYNYEDYVFQGYKFNDLPDLVSTFEAKAGDAVLVGQLNGQGREGIIIGGLNHPARKTKIKADDGPQYKSEFNGIETFINKDGELIVTFKGQPLNKALLNSIPTIQIPPAIYNPTVGTTYYKFDKMGGWEINDNAVTGKQFLKIDKSKGTMELASGLTISLKMTKLTGKVELACKTLSIDSMLKADLKTIAFSVDATAKISMKAPKVAIGMSGIELLDQLAQLVDALGKIAPISPIGPCTPLAATPAWIQIELIKAKIKLITGSL